MGCNSPNLALLRLQDSVHGLRLRDQASYNFTQPRVRLGSVHLFDHPFINCRSAYERREEGQRARQGRVLPLFTIVRFGNTACDSTDADKNGTCYTSAECATKGGTAAGTCASGFGVCCNFDGTSVS